MFMLNFIIAIICESYLTVASKVKLMEAEQEFFTDVFSVSLMCCKSFVYRWPDQLTLIQKLACLRTKRVGFVEMRQAFPHMNPLTLSTLMRHYRNFEPIRRRSAAVMTEFSTATREIMEKMSVMSKYPFLGQEPGFSLEIMCYVHYCIIAGFAASCV